MKLALILGAVILVLLFIIAVVSQICKKLQAENNEIREQIVKQNSTIAQLIKHAEEVSAITADKGKVENEIKKAKTDEELVAIANAIVSTNNERLRNKGKKR